MPTEQKSKKKQFSEKVARQNKLCGIFLVFFSSSYLYHLPTTALSYFCKHFYRNRNFSRDFYSYIPASMLFMPVSYPVRRLRLIRHKALYWYSWYIHYCGMMAYRKKNPVALKFATCY